MHTPKYTLTEEFRLPWHYQTNADKYTHIIRNKSDGWVLSLAQNSTPSLERTAKFIVTVCNAYEENQRTIEKLIKALKLCKEWSESRRTINSTSISCMCDEAINNYESRKETK